MKNKSRMTIASLIFSAVFTGFSGSAFAGGLAQNSNAKSNVSLSTKWFADGVASYTTITGTNEDRTHPLNVTVQYTTRAFGKQPEVHTWVGTIQPQQKVWINNAIGVGPATAEVISATAGG